MFWLINSIVGSFLQRLIDYLPSFLGGLVIFFIGLLLAELLKRILSTVITFFRLEYVFSKTKLTTKTEVKFWKEVLIEILKWTVIILFLIPTLEAWGLSRATVVLNQILFYIPNVVVAVVIAFVGLVTGNLVADLVRHSVKTLGKKTANSLAFLAKSAIIFFTVLIVLNQLGVAQDLIKILFTGIIAMITIAGGLAFGLGGQDMARDILKDLKKKLG